MYKGVYGSLEEDLKEIGKLKHIKSIIIDIFDKVKNNRYKEKEFINRVISYYFTKMHGITPIRELRMIGRIFVVLVNGKESKNYSYFEYRFINKFIRSLLSNNNFYENIFRKVIGVDNDKNF